MALDMLLRLMLGRASRRYLLLLDAQTRVEALWRMTDPHDGHAVEEFSDAAAAVSIAAQQRSVSLTLATQRRYLSEMGTELGSYVPTIPDQVRMYSTARPYRFAEPVAVRTSSGVEQRLPVAEVFNRPARLYRRLMEDGADSDHALDVAAQRVKMELATNVALAERETEYEITKRAGIVDLDVIGWRRVIRPERSRTGTCGLCVAASQRIYKTDELRPIHTGCKCDVLPIKAGADGDPGLQLNTDDLKRLYDDAGGTAAKQLHRTKYRVDEHGELRSLLVPKRRGQQIPRYRDNDTPSLVDLDAEAARFNEQQLTLMRQLLTKSLAAGRGDNDQRVVWQRAQIRRYEALLGL
ncbi:hypothetical protein OG563_26480 [Nocardia vinacea]|uniref:Phage head morphogenesis domain-containing protein n=1 Tax=Nocardia vinacea TaxID=96468 RepID=A0ABZ1YHW9_9NOCA|nr:hypothetical protein [Nocardia vinacea]